MEEWEDTDDSLPEDVCLDQDLSPQECGASGKPKSSTSSGPFTLRRLVAKDNLNIASSTQTLLEDKRELSESTSLDTGHSHQSPSHSLNSILSRNGPIGRDSDVSAGRHTASSKQIFTEEHSSKTPSFLSEFP